jgi:hypothetical protein
MTTLSTNESAVRSRAQRAGYIVRKSRRIQSLDNYGEYMLVEARSNFAVLGSRFDATLEDIADYIDEE